MKYIHSLYIGLLSLLFIGCQEEQLNNMQTGGFQISLQDVAADITTKTLPENLEDPVVSNFQLKITNEVSGTSIYNGAYTSNLIPASTGVYSITATHGDNPTLAKDNPYYKGDTTGVELEEDQVASVELKCRVANALASVVYTSEAMFKEVFTDYGVKVGIGTLMVDLENGTTESAYYQAGSIPTFTFVGTLKGNGKEVTKVLEDTKLTDPSTFAAGQHCKITLSLSTTTAGVNLDIEKVEATPVTITATIPMEWLPAPKVSATGFDENKTLTIYETVAPDAASIDFEVAQPLQDLSFTLNFEDEQFTSLNKDYQLSTMTDEEKIALSDAGITLPLIGSNEPKIAFSQAFNARLLSKNDGVVNNKITINSVQANNRENKDEAPLTYIIAVHKPEFSVSVLPGNIWTKEFIAEEITVEEGKGDLGIIKKDLVYQYQDSDGEWKNCSNQDSRQQIFAEHPQHRNYKVRALYRNVLASNEVDVELEEPKALPNGNMEEWISSTRYKQPYYQPWSNEAWWDTNNNETMSKSYLTYPNYKCFPTTTYTDGGVSGKAVVIRSVAVNGWNSEVMGEGKTRGVFYAGSTSEDGTMTEGREWFSRPSQLTFMYQYDSYDNEHFGVYVELISQDGTIIASGQFVSTQGVSISNFEKVEVPLNYMDSSLKAGKIKIRFVSVADGESVSTRKQTISIPAGSYKIYGGSALTVDDITLVYDK
ncbi:putative uncharacterized protein [Parabacteroides sp. CAG:409]|nr:putative uncharacterized protein [Parabacteroides sp. CAG:409]